MLKMNIMYNPAPIHSATATNHTGKANNSVSKEIVVGENETQNN